MTTLLPEYLARVNFIRNDAEHVVIVGRRRSRAARPLRRRALSSSTGKLNAMLLGWSYDDEARYPLDSVTWKGAVGDGLSAYSIASAIDIMRPR